MLKKELGQKNWLGKIGLFVFSFLFFPYLSSALPILNNHLRQCASLNQNECAMPEGWREQPKRRQVSRFGTGPEVHYCPGGFKRLSKTINKNNNCFLSQPATEKPEKATWYTLIINSHDKRCASLHGECAMPEGWKEAPQKRQVTTPYGGGPGRLVSYCPHGYYHVGQVNNKAINAVPGIGTIGYDQTEEKRNCTPLTRAEVKARWANFEKLKEACGVYVMRKKYFWSKKKKKYSRLDPICVAKVKYEEAKEQCRIPAQNIDVNTCLLEVEKTYRDAYISALCNVQKESENHGPEDCKSTLSAFLSEKECEAPGDSTITPDTTNTDNTERVHGFR